MIELNSCKLSVRTLILVAFSSIVVASPALAATVLPDSANLPRPDTQPAPPVIISPDIENKTQEKYPAPMQDKSDIKVTINKLKFIGNKNISESDLTALLKDYLGKPLGISELNKMTAAVTHYYRQLGYMLAEAYLPEQDVTQDTLVIAVVEGYLGVIKLESKGNLDEGFLRKMATHNLAENEAITEANLVRNITIINSLPGIRASSELAPGQEVGYSDVSISAEAEPILGGYVVANTYGNRFTSREVLSAGVFLNNLAGRGDRLALNLKNSLHERQRGVQLSYILPVHESGTLLNLNAGYSDYRLKGEFSKLGATGDTSFASVFLDQPLLRARRANITSRAGLSYKDVSDEVSAFLLDNHRDIKAVELGLFSDWRDARFSGFNQLGLTLKFGDVDFKNNLAESLDNTGAETKGSFVKYNLLASRNQPLSQAFNLIARAEYQGTDKNLDGAEKLSIGGPNRWREFGDLPASADRGLLAGLELRKTPISLANLAGFLQMFTSAEISPYVFYDYGRGNINHNALSNDSHVRSRQYGAGLDMQFAKRWTFDFAVSHEKTDVDGIDSEQETRAWGQVRADF
jgi:hemolysin activation/secretion protein